MFLCFNINGRIYKLCVLGVLFDKWEIVSGICDINCVNSWEGVLEFVGGIRYG